LPDHIIDGRIMLILGKYGGKAYGGFREFRIVPVMGVFGVWVP